VSAMGLLGLFLSFTGLTALVAHSTSRRTRELGIRIALGARAPHLVWTSISSTTMIGLAGLPIGTGSTAAPSALFRGVLNGLTPYNPVIYSIAIVLWTAVIGIACLAPALHLLNADPVRALRKSD